MASRLDPFLEKLLFRKVQDRWSRAATESPGMDLATLRLWRGRARAMRREIDRVLHMADQRLTLPLIGASHDRKPLGTDWSWRPDLWCGLVTKSGGAGQGSKTPVSGDVTLFHDCVAPELIVRQLRNRDAADRAPFGMALEMFGFDGSFLSLAINLPEAAVTGLKPRHVMRVETILHAERPVEVFARLNIKHGPNVEQILQDLPAAGQPQMAEFDLAYSKLDDKRVEKMWLDLIFKRPAINQITLRDVTVSRRPRADL